MNKELSNKVRQLSKLKQYKNKSPEEITNIAKERLESTRYSLPDLWINKAEKKKANKIFQQYLSTYPRLNKSDIQLIREIVYLEILNVRYKESINRLQKNKETANVVPSKLTKEYRENLDKILNIKEKLGLFTDQSKSHDPFQYIQALKKKFKIWVEDNQGSRKIDYPIICPSCKHGWVEALMLRIKTDKWDVQKHPFFKDKILANKKLWQLYKENKISKQDVAEILNVGLDYVDWLEEKIYYKK